MVKMQYSIIEQIVDTVDTVGTVLEQIVLEQIVLERKKKKKTTKDIVSQKRKKRKYIQEPLLYSKQTARTAIRPQKMTTMKTLFDTIQPTCIRKIFDSVVQAFESRILST